MKVGSEVERLVSRNKYMLAQETADRIRRFHEMAKSGALEDDPIAALVAAGRLLRDALKCLDMLLEDGQ